MFYGTGPRSLTHKNIVQRCSKFGQTLHCGHPVVIIGFSTIYMSKWAQIRTHQREKICILIAQDVRTKVVVK